MHVCAKQLNKDKYIAVIVIITSSLRLQGIFLLLHQAVNLCHFGAVDWKQTT